MSMLESKAGSPVLSFFRGMFLVVSALVLAPGVLFGSLFLVFTPINILEGRITLLAIYAVGYALLQLTSLSAWFRSSRTHGGLTFVAWSTANIICAVALIVELQRQISAFDGECGQVLLGPIYMQMAACGTVLGLLLLSFDCWALQPKVNEQ